MASDAAAAAAAAAEAFASCRASFDGICEFLGVPQGEMPPDKLFPHIATFIELVAKDTNFVVARRERQRKARAQAEEKASREQTASPPSAEPLPTTPLAPPPVRRQPPATAPHPQPPQRARPAPPRLRPPPPPPVSPPATPDGVGGGPGQLQDGTVPAASSAPERSLRRQQQQAARSRGSSWARRHPGNAGGQALGNGRCDDADEQEDDDGDLDFGSESPGPLQGSTGTASTALGRPPSQASAPASVSGDVPMALPRMQRSSSAAPPRRSRRASLLSDTASARLPQRQGSIAPSDGAFSDRIASSIRSSIRRNMRQSVVALSALSALGSSRSMEGLLPEAELTVESDNE